MDDFLTDEQMEALSSGGAPQQVSPQPAAADFISDADMDQMAARAASAAQGTGPVVSDADMERMANPDHAAVNETVRAAIHKGGSRDQVVQLLQQNGVAVSPDLIGKVDRAVAWRKRHGSYNGYVDLFPEQTHPETPHPQDIRTEPKHEVSALRAFGEGLRQGVSLGFSDEIDAGVGAAVNSVGNLVGLGNGQDFGDYYNEARDERRDLIRDAEDQHYYAYNGGQVVGSIAPAMIPGGAGVGLARVAGRAALEAAIYGAGSSEADTVDGVAGDAALGGTIGGLTAGTLNRAGSVVSPRVAPLVEKLMGRGVELTPSQILRAGGPVSRAIGGTAEIVGRRGVVTGEAMRAAEGRATSLESFVARHDDALAQATAQGLNATPRHPDLLAGARSLIGKPAKEASQADMLANVLLGYGSSGGTLAADLGLASIYTKPGQAVVNSLLTGRQGPVPKAVRGITQRLSPLAGNAAAALTPTTEK